MSEWVVAVDGKGGGGGVLKKYVNKIDYLNGMQCLQSSATPVGQVL